MRNTIFNGIGITLILLVVSAPQVFGQTYEEKREKILNEQTNTRAEINVLDARIKTYEKRVNKAENEYQQLYRKYEDLNRLIALQDDKIATLEREQRSITEEIVITEEEIALRERELQLLIDNYKDILLYTYKKGRISSLEMILTSSSINQMLVRSQYLQKLEEHKSKQAEQIRVRQNELENIKEDLEESHYKNQLVLAEIVDEKSKLSNQQVSQRQNVEKIKAESTDLLAELRKYRKQKENLEDTFASLISEKERIDKLENERQARLAEARKIADAARRAEEVAKYSTPTRGSYVSDETLSAYEQNFAISKGKLPWPVSTRTVSQKFGVTRNPLYGTRREFPGINIVTEAGEDVRVVSDGQVFAVQPVPGYGNVVFVKHGTYYTAYGNLSEIDVSVSAVLKAGTVIGKSGTELSEMGETLFFMVRKNNTDLNPEDWLSSS